MAKKALNFEKSIERLEKIVAEMEDNLPDLDRTLALFSEGSELVKQCSAKLNETKKKIQIITKAGAMEDFNDEK
jgi:exodeoxyribonuclease VII small subunit